MNGSRRVLRDDRSNASAFAILKPIHPRLPRRRGGGASVPVPSSLQSLDVAGGRHSSRRQHDGTAPARIAPTPLSYCTAPTLARKSTQRGSHG